MRSRARGTRIARLQLQPRPTWSTLRRESRDKPVIIRRRLSGDSHFAREQFRARRATTSASTSSRALRGVGEQQRRAREPTRDPNLSSSHHCVAHARVERLCDSGRSSSDRNWVPLTPWLERGTPGRVGRDSWNKGHDTCEWRVTFYEGGRSAIRDYGRAGTRTRERSSGGDHGPWHLLRDDQIATPGCAQDLHGLQGTNSPPHAADPVTWGSETRLYVWCLGSRRELTSPSLGSTGSRLMISWAASSGKSLRQAMALPRSRPVGIAGSRRARGIWSATPD